MHPALLVYCEQSVQYRHPLLLASITVVVERGGTGWLLARTRTGFIAKPRSAYTERTPVSGNFIMVERAETTPLLRQSRGGYPGSRLQRSQVHPFHKSSATAASSRRTTSSATTPSSSHQTIHIPISNRIWRIVVSLPHQMLCFASPVLPPCCGVCCCFTCIRTSEFGVMQRFGKFERILQPGMHFMKWPMEREAGRISMRIKQLDIRMETKSKDHVFIRVHVSIQYQTNATHLFNSFYSLQSPTRQITSHTHDILRSTLPQLELDDIFSSQDSIAFELNDSLNDIMNEYGYVVHHALICEIKPNDHVKQSMNEMEASRRMKEAMPHKAEAVWIEKVKEAEARAERSYLNGVGVARERGAIANGMREVAAAVVKDGCSCDGGKSVVSISPKGVMDLLLMTSYMDLITELNSPRGTRSVTDESRDDSHSPSTSLFLQHMPETVSQLTAKAKECFESATSDAVKVENLLEL